MTSTQTIYGLISDCGDGSSSIHWFRSKETVDEMLDEANGHDNYWCNESEPAEVLTFPAGLDLEATGFYFRD